MENEEIRLYEMLLNVKQELAEVRKMCDNLKEELDKLKDSDVGSGIYLDGVPDVYRKQIESELGKGKR